MVEQITFEQALEWEVSRLSNFRSWYIRQFGLYEKFAMGVLKKYNHYVESNEFANQEKALEEAKMLIK